jgi:hypothetical protein
MYQNINKRTSLGTKSFIEQFIFKNSCNRNLENQNIKLKDE